VLEVKGGRRKEDKDVEVVEEGSAETLGKTRPSQSL
jgi:hypothetical protein